MSSEEIPVVTRVERLKQIYSDVATGTTYKDQALQAEFKMLRDELMADAGLKSRLPDFVAQYRQLAEFWPFVQSQGSYADRRQFIGLAFNPVLDWLENKDKLPVTEFTDAEALKNPEGVRAAWDKAKARLANDPEGAVTAAVSFLDTVMKNIHEALPRKSQVLSTDDDLMQVFKKLRTDMRLDAEKTTNEALLQVGQGVLTVVNGLATIRNRKGDAHGKPPSAETPDQHLAELAVNLAGSIATFLTAEFQRQSASSSKTV